MQVRFLEGQRAGETAILPYHVARPLIEARRVEAIDKVVADRILGAENKPEALAEKQPPISQPPLRGRLKRAPGK